jgi:hypothetical protein
MKQFKVRIHAPSQRPAATVVLSDQRERACWLPESRSAEAVFFVEEIEAESEEVRQRISTALFRTSAPVWKGGSSVSKRVRTRGDYLASEPYGTPAFWRAAFGLLERETGLRYDLQDYGQMLRGMEAPAIVDQSAEKVTAEEVRREASRYIVHELGDRLWAGEPTYDERNERWAVPIHSRSLSADVTLGYITLNEQGVVVHAPSRRDVQHAVQKHQPAAPSPAPPRPGTLAWQFMSTVGGEEGKQIQEFSFKWQRETGTVSGRLRFAPRKGGVLPQLHLVPAPDAPCAFTLRFPDGTERVLTVDESGWSEPREVVPQATADQWRDATLSFAFGEVALRLGDVVGNNE